MLKEIEEIVRVPTDILDKTIGMLNHAGHIVLHSRYFLNRFRQMIQRCKKYSPQNLPIVTRKDIPFWISMLEHASEKGMDINNITFTEPTETCISDAYEFGMGG